MFMDTHTFGEHHPYLHKIDFGLCCGAFGLLEASYLLQDHVPLTAKLEVGFDGIASLCILHIQENTH